MAEEKSKGADPAPVNVKEKFQKLADEAKAKMSSEPAEVKEAPEKSDDEKKADELETKCNEILKEYGGLEGNVPVQHEYWNLRNQVRGLRKKF